jgi:hypothetical protein
MCQGHANFHYFYCQGCYLKVTGQILSDLKLCRFLMDCQLFGLYLFTSQDVLRENLCLHLALGGESVSPFLFGLYILIHNGLSKQLAHFQEGDRPYSVYHAIDFFPTFLKKMAGSIW